MMSKHLRYPSRCVCDAHHRCTVRCVAAAILGLAFALSTASAAAADNSLLTLADALRLAEARAPALAASTAAASAARDLGVAAGQLPNPVLTVGVENVPADGPDAFSLMRDFMTMRRVGVMQEYVSQDKRSARRERAEREALRLESERSVARTEIRTEVTSAWYDRSYARRAGALLQSLDDELAMQQRVVEAQVGSAKASTGDVLAVRAMQVQVQDQVRNARRQQESATVRLERRLGADARRPTADEPGPSTAAALAALAAHDAQDTPPLRVLESQLALSDAEVTVAELDRRPNVSWEVSYALRGPSYSNMVSVSVRVPLPLDRADREDREVAARLAQRDQVRAMLEDARGRERANFAVLRGDWQTLREREEALEETLLPVTKQRLAVQLAAYRSGQAGLSGVLEARRAEIEAQLQLLDLKRDAARLWAQLQYSYLAPVAATGVQP